MAALTSVLPMVAVASAAVAMDQSTKSKLRQVPPIIIATKGFVFDKPRLGCQHSSRDCVLALACWAELLRRSLPLLAERVQIGCTCKPSRRQSELC